LEKIYGGVTEQVAGEFVAGESIVLGIFLFGVEMTERDFQVVRHAAEEYVAAVVEG